VTEMAESYAIKFSFVYFWEAAAHATLKIKPARCVTSPDSQTSSVGVANPHFTRIKTMAPNRFLLPVWELHFRSHRLKLAAVVRINYILKMAMLMQE